VSTIRPLERDDLPAVARIVAVALPNAPRPDEGLERFLADITLDHPWADPEIPSLVGIGDDGRIAGAVAVHARRLLVGDRTVRAACCSHLVVDPEAPAGALGARILTRFMGGPQELSYSDTAIEVVGRVWQAAGGRVEQGRSTIWVRPLRPLVWGGRLAAGLVRRKTASGLAPVGGLPMAFEAGRRLRHRGTSPAPAAGERPAAAPLRPEDLVEHGPAVTGWTDVRAAWDEEFARWTFAALGRRHGASNVVGRLLRRGETPIGWYVYLRSGAGQGRVLQLAARRREVDAVVGELFAGAREDGIVLLRGRIEPHLAEALRARHCALGFGDRFVMHGDAALLARLESPASLLTKLEGEWWA
jgi:hypothetical protein